MFKIWWIYISVKYYLFNIILYVTDLDPKLFPQEAITYLGGNIKFTCTKANISFETGWKTMLLPLSFIPASDNINVTLNSYVHNIDLNNTDVQCISRCPVTGMLYFSNVGKILIQGKYYDFCHLNGYDKVGNQIAGPAVQLEDVTVSGVIPITDSFALKPSGK